MATKPKERFTANVRVTLIIEVPLTAKSITDAVEEANGLQLNDVVRAPLHQIVDNDAPQVVAVLSSAWL